MPQIAQIAATYASQIFWLVLTFGFVFFVIGLGMVPKIQATLKDRDRQIASDLAAAERARVHAHARDTAYRAQVEQNRAEVLNITQAAKLKAAAQADTLLAKADAELTLRLAEAEARITHAANAARAEIDAAAVEAAQALVAKLSGTSVTAAQFVSAVKAVRAHD